MEHAASVKQHFFDPVEFIFGQNQSYIFGVTESGCVGRMTQVNK
jgi:hypothetical protein